MLVRAGSRGQLDSRGDCPLRSELEYSFDLPPSEASPRLAWRRCVCVGGGSSEYHFVLVGRSQGQHGGGGGRDCKCGGWLITPLRSLQRCGRRTQVCFTSEGFITPPSCRRGGFVCVDSTAHTVSGLEHHDLDLAFGGSWPACMLGGGGKGKRDYQC
jgi:hypothetical protein